MLEIRDVHKTYRPKKGVPVKALDGISLSFADTGLVFILGKSGSGKSTLLNVIGGLDVADSGEFVIKGKSSKNFSQADFDSYRNTFIGFIFQEYNILNEFTVGQNIALAMKLQGKKVDNAALNALLEEVDLSGYGNRKPNELSGGQKQRVAIARALIKEPEIIMADEPTGALDSNTGRQVFDTLKKLSKTKLVIVVSHDREFAEYYGDRVIEFADGRIISDITKETAESEKQSEGVSIVDNKIFHIRKGYKLTAADVKKIQSYIDNAQSDTIISMDERSNNSFCQIARIDKDGNQEVFRETDNATLSKENEKYDGSSKFIRSKLPFSHAFKIGASSLKTKPFRLFITILLCFVSFAMFGLADTIGSFDTVSTTVSSISDSNYDSVVFATKLLNDYDYYETLSASEKDLERLESATGLKFNGVLSEDSYLPLYDSTKLSGKNSSQYYNKSLVGYLPASEDKFAEYGFGALTGNYPKAADEIVITKYTYEQLAISGFYSGEDYSQDREIIKADEFETIEEFLELEPKIYLDNYRSGSKLWKVVGVVETNADAAGRFAQYKPADEMSEGNIMDYFMLTEMQQYFRYGYHSLGYVSQTAYQQMHNTATAGGTASIGMYAPGYISLYDNHNGNSMGNSFKSVAKDSELSNLDVLWVDGTARTSLADNEFVVAIDQSFFNYVGGNYFDIDTVDMSFDQTYFGGTVRITFDTVYDLRYYLREQVTLCMAAQDLTSAQIEKFRTYIKNIGEEYGNGAMQHVVYDMNRASYWRFVDNNYITFDDPAIPEVTNAAAVDSLTEDQLRYLYYGYLNTREFSFDGDYNADQGMYELIILIGGWKENAIGLDSGGMVYYYNYQKLLYSHLLANIDYTVTFNRMSLSFDNGGSGRYEEGEFKIVGFYFSKPIFDEYGNAMDDENRVLINNAAYEQAQSLELGVYTFFIAPMPTSRSVIESLVNLHFDKSAVRGFTMQNGVTYMMSQINSLLEVLGTVFLWIGVGLAVFSMLLLSNYIAVSISYKKREIGILRAVGAKSSDVFSIFFSESLIIALINFVLAMVVCIVGCSLLNGMLRNDYNFEITLLNFGVRQVGLMLLISVGIALIASFLPVYRLSRKKPIETIRTA